MDYDSDGGFEEISPAGGGGFRAYAEQLRGAISEEDTLQVACENLRAAIALLLEANRELAARAGGAATSTVARHREVNNPTAIRICKPLSVLDAI